MRLKETLLAAAFVAFACAAEAYACQCRAPQPPCAEYAEADAVFVGSVAKVAPDERMAEERVSFKVERAFRGVGGESVELVDTMTSCRVGFQEGEKYLVYAFRHAPTDTLSTHACSRTRSVSRAADDLAYLEGLPRRAPGQLILGHLAHGETRLANVRVAARAGRRSYRAVSDEKGRFKIPVARPGRYTVSIALPHNSDVMGTSEQLDKISSRVRTDTHTVLEYEVNVAAGGCAYIDVPLFVVRGP